MKNSYICDMQKIDLNIKILKALIDADIVDGSYIGKGAQEIVEKINDLAEAVYKIK